MENNKQLLKLKESPIFIRRSIRKYKEKEIEKQKIENIIRAAMQAPTSGNEQPWEFIIVKNKDTLRNISKASKYVTMIREAGVVIVVLCNNNYLKVNGDYWQQDLGAVTQNILIQTVIEGLGGVWLGVAPDKEMIKYLTDMFNLPDNIVPYALVSIGYPDDTIENKFVDRYKKERIHLEKW